MPTKRLYSRIKRYIPDDLYLKLYRLMYVSDLTNNEKTTMIQIYLNEAGVDYLSLGPGTNRYAVLIDQVVFKFALDEDGMIDNRREMLYTERLQPYVIKCYECIKNGLVMVCERIRVIDSINFRTYRDKILDILKDITRQGFLIGDVGINEKNYLNWGIRPNGEVCCLDFAYIYNVKYNLFKCSCKDHPFLEWDDMFVNLICPSCHRQYTFGELRRKISKVAQEKEIGDIQRLSYNLKSPEEIVEIDPRFTPSDHEEKKEKKVNVYEQNRKEAKAYQKYLKRQREAIDWDYPTGPLSKIEEDD